MLWGLKVRAMILAFGTFWACYFFLGWHPLFRPRVFPLTDLDVWAGYRPGGWGWVYESIFVISAAVPWLVVTRDQLRRFLTGFTLLSLTSFLVFALFPVTCPRPAGAAPGGFLGLITRLDSPLNSFPSLHGSCLIYNLALAHRLFGRNMPILAAIALWVWVGLIFFAVLAIKQHYAVDLVVGGLLGWAADAIAWRSAPARWGPDGGIVAR